MGGAQRAGRKGGSSCYSEQGAKYVMAAIPGNRQGFMEIGEAGQGRTYDRRGKQRPGRLCITAKGNTGITSYEYPV